ncbi:MAG TPA: LytTR family DNA-binding domain-containing protein [Gemmatimonadaceae bacterium]|nr:LytTR family DNA-binding domain-containing protein [Gemmatimonadaceae bacterium]
MMPATRYSVLVVDDEPLARQRIRQLLSSAPDFAVVGECSDGAAVEAAVSALRPDIVFLDIKMIHADGFTAQAAIRNVVRHVVFVTAYPEHAARAFDVAALDYLVKPLTRERFNAALDRVRRAGVADPTPRIFLGSQHGGVSVPIADINWIEADGAYVVVHAAGKRHVLRESLAEMLERLGGLRFARIHRSAVVNLDRVRATRRVREGLEIELQDGTRVPVSRRRARELLERLNDVRRAVS